MSKLNDLFGDINFKNIEGNPDFKEDSVREIIILPILKELGYKENNIVRSKTLQHPFLKIGSKKRQVKLIPDYSLKIDNSYVCILDAKSPSEKIINSDNVEQVYCYATHPEVRSNYFALCNGIEFSLFKTTETNIPILYFKIIELEENLEKLYQILSPSNFQDGKQFIYIQKHNNNQLFDYLNRPLLEEIPVKKQATHRHFGVHGYFTKQSWNVVSEYIENFTQKGDLILDPFGGSGVTAVEALMKERKAINIDLNPMAIFLLESLVAPIKQSDLAQAFQEIKDEYQKKEPKTKTEINNTIKKFSGPKDILLPKGSDVDSVVKLFSKKQLAQLSLLKSLIKKQKDKNIQQSLLLMFSGLLTKMNLTYHSSSTRGDGAGDSSAFRYYRYRIAQKPVDIDVMKYFELRYSKVSKAKKEIEYFINNKTIDNVVIKKGTATNLSFVHNESIDYIYTDPPYGAKIPYLDLSAMWNAWLDLDVSEEDYMQEAIEGGEHDKTKSDYNKLISQSIKEMYRVLKFNRWLSFVFAHKDPEFWHLIIDTAESCGFEYMGAVTQKNGQTSFKKRQHPFTVLSGQLIINFRKVKNPKIIMKANLGMNIMEIIIQTIEGIIAKNNGATLEQVNDEIIIKGLELGFLDLLKKQYNDITPILMEKFDYDDATEIFTIKKGMKFKTHIDVRLRIKYYLISYLRRMEKENKTPKLDDIIFSIMPLLKNGTTPENQTILNVLQDIADRIGEDGWRLKQKGQLHLDIELF